MQQALCNEISSISTFGKSLVTFLKQNGYRSLLLRTLMLQISVLLPI